MRCRPAVTFNDNSQFYFICLLVCLFSPFIFTLRTGFSDDSTQRTQSELQRKLWLRDVSNGQAFFFSFFWVSPFWVRVSSDCNSEMCNCPWKFQMFFKSKFPHRLCHIEYIFDGIELQTVRWRESLSLKQPKSLEGNWVFLFQQKLPIFSKCFRFDSFNEGFYLLVQQTQVVTIFVLTIFA